MRKIAVGARLQHNTVSIRVEGHVSYYAAKLVAAGLKKKGEGSYWSNHFSVANTTVAKRAIGAVLFSLNIPFRHVALDLSCIFGEAV